MMYILNLIPISMLYTLLSFFFIIPNIHVFTLVHLKSSIITAVQFYQIYFEISVWIATSFITMTVSCGFIGISIKYSKNWVAIIISANNRVLNNSVGKTTNFCSRQIHNLQIWIFWSYSSPPKILISCYYWHSIFRSRINL